MKTMRIFLKILALVIIIQLIMPINTSKASFWSDIFKYGDEFVETGASQQNSDVASDGKTMEIMNDLYRILFPLGIVITVIIGGVLGIKFMMASAEDKAKVKESMVPYVVGCAVIYGAFGIWKIAIAIFSALA